MDKTRINLANPEELRRVPGLDGAAADAILRHRAAHGPIQDAAELATILGRPDVSASLLDRVDFAPADDTAPEAPGA